MKANLLIGFFFTLTLSFSQNERKVISCIDSINSLALSHYESKDITQSFNCLLKTVKLSDSISDDYGNSQANFLLGNLYNYMGLSKEAESCYLKMFDKAKKIDDNYLMASASLSLGEIYRQNKPLEEFVPFFNDALGYALKSDVTDENNIDKKQSIQFDTRLKLSQIYMDHNQPDEVYLNLLEAEKCLTNNGYSKASLSYTFGLYFAKTNSFNLANKKYSEALSYLDKSNNDVSYGDKVFLSSQIYKELSNSYASLDKTQEAYEFLLKHTSFREKFINEEKIKEEKKANSKFFIEEYKNIAETANNERLLQQKISDKIKIVNIAISVAIVVLLILLLILIKNYRSKKRLSLILKERNEHLEIAKDQAEKSSKLKTEFVSNVTHELRTPLYGVVGLTSLMLENNKLCEEDFKLLKSLKYSGDYLLNLVNDILQIGKMESETVELKNVSINLKDMVNGIIGSFEYRLQESNNQIHVLIDNSTPELIVCDSVRLSQILINLLGNSIKFTQNGNIWLRVILMSSDGENADIRFEIEDNGTGIPESKHKIIFDNFSQLDENSNINYQGTGLGLSIVKKLVTLFNSKIELKSELGKGSTFSFNVSFKIDKNEMAKTKTNDAGKIVSLNKQYNILVAEDNKINQIVTKNLLKKANFNCDVVENGLECIKTFNQNTYDLILMDINMPVMNGNVATEEIRRLNPDIPIIALTAADIDEAKKNIGSIGYSGIITKPFDNIEFFQVINSHIQKSKSKNNLEDILVMVS